MNAIPWMDWFVRAATLLAVVAMLGCGDGLVEPQPDVSPPPDMPFGGKFDTLAEIPDGWGLVRVTAPDVGDTPVATSIRVVDTLGRTVWLRANEAAGVPAGEICVVLAHRQERTDDGFSADGEDWRSCLEVEADVEHEVALGAVRLTPDAARLGDAVGGLSVRFDFARGEGYSTARASLWFHGRTGPRAIYSFEDALGVRAGKPIYEPMGEIAIRAGDVADLSLPSVDWRWQLWVHPAHRSLPDATDGCGAALQPFYVGHDGRCRTGCSPSDLSFRPLERVVVAPDVPTVFELLPRLRASSSRQPWWGFSVGELAARVDEPREANGRVDLYLGRIELSSETVSPPADGYELAPSYRLALLHESGSARVRVPDEVNTECNPTHWTEELDVDYGLDVLPGRYDVALTWISPDGEPISELLVYETPNNNSR